MPWKPTLRNPLKGCMVVLVAGVGAGYGLYELLF